jgi:hypothetical protein
MTLPKLKSEMDRAVSLPGVANIWTQPIINRIDMLTTGIRSEIGVKLFGSDLTVLEAKAREIADAVRTVKGASDIYPEQVTGGLYLDIKPNREAAARYGIDVGECPRDRSQWGAYSSWTSSGYQAGVRTGADQQREWLAGGFGSLECAWTGRGQRDRRCRKGHQGQGSITSWVLLQLERAI